MPIFSTCFGTSPFSSPRGGVAPARTVRENLLLPEHSRIYLLKVTPYNPGGAAEVPLYFSAGDAIFISDSTDTPASTLFKPRWASSSYSYSVNVFSGRSLSENVNAGLGDLNIVNTDGDADTALNTYYWDGRSCTIYAGYAGLKFMDFIPVYTGIIDSIHWSFDTFTVRLRDKRTAKSIK